MIEAKDKHPQTSKKERIFNGNERLPTEHVFSNREKQQNIDTSAFPRTSRNATIAVKIYVKYCKKKEVKKNLSSAIGRQLPYHESQELLEQYNGCNDNKKK